MKTKIENSRTVVTINNPKLWWVRGYGAQHLYDLSITLEKDGTIIDKLEKKIGLRTLTVSTAHSYDGNEFCFVINGVKIFSMGANYVPQDSLYARITSESVKKRIDDFIFANYNTIRVWGGDSSFESYREHKFRFCSEYCFESFPSMKTIDSYSEKNNQNIFSKVMENHQKCKTGNKKLLMYLSENYLYPTSFENLVYTSQIMQAVAIRSAVEHFRRVRGYCMGSLYWQANDCWPVCSWSSVDYFGRYKALHYAARKFYAPISEGVFVKGNNVIVNISNESTENHNLTLRWGLQKNDLSVIEKGNVTVNVNKLSSLDVVNIDFDNFDPYTTFFTADLYDGDEFIMRRSERFVKPKHLNWIEPNITVEAQDIDCGIKLLISADNYASMVEIDFNNYDIILSDNYIDLSEKKYYTVICETNHTKEEILSNIKFKSIFDIK